MIRRGGPDDWADLEAMLKEEGHERKDMAFMDFETWVCEENGQVVGFYTIQSLGSLPHLLHFCTRRGFRSHFLFRRMARHFKALVNERSLGFIVNCPTENIRLCRLIVLYLKALPYALHEDHYYFFKGVTYGKEIIRAAAA